MVAHSPPYTIPVSIIFLCYEQIKGRDGLVFCILAAITLVRYVCTTDFVSY